MNVVHRAPDRPDPVFVVLSTVFIGVIVASNLMGTKVIPFFSIGAFEITGSVAIFLFPLSFLATDIITEIWGSSATRALIGATVAVLVLILLVTSVATIVTPAERFAAQNEAYVSVFSSSTRIILASIVAFALSQAHDVWAFEWWKRLTGGRHLWLRNNASTAVSQLLDTAIFMLIAFWGVSPRFTLGFVLGSMLPPYYVLKLLMAGLDTPLIYLAVSAIRRRNVAIVPAS